MEYLERASAKIGAKFIEYRPETGSWVFEVMIFDSFFHFRFGHIFCHVDKIYSILEIRYCSG